MASPLPNAIETTSNYLGMEIVVGFCLMFALGALLHLKLGDRGLGLAQNGFALSIGLFFGVFAMRILQQAL